jgi:hypothetical protein
MADGKNDRKYNGGGNHRQREVRDNLVFQADPGRQYGCHYDQQALPIDDQSYLRKTLHGRPQNPK